MNFRPCIDLHNGKVKQIVGSSLSDDPGRAPKTNFETDLPSRYFAEMFRRDKLSGGHIIMLGPGNEAAAREALAAYPGGFHVGGGITPANAASFLDAGASHVIVTSYVFREGAIDEKRLVEISRAIGKNRLVLDLSCKEKGGRYLIVTDRWRKFTGVAISRETLGRLSGYCDEFLVHAADVEGKRQGIDEALTVLLAVSPVPVIYAGGIRSLDDLERIRQLGKGRLDFTVGSALDLYGGELKYRDVIAWCARSNRSPGPHPQ
jgi:phosphoribosylformimino-5-aminoimidazole carboxamide ribotide isomerase